MGFALVIKFILLGIILFSAISYLFQRSQNKQNLREAIDKTEPVRELTEEEYQLLEPYLYDKKLVSPYKPQSFLVNRNVSIIVGECIRHSVKTNGSESSYYFTIGGIEVFLPYKIDNYSMEENIAEVVFTSKYAFVVNLNGFSLATAKAEQDKELLLNEQWDQGSSGQFKTITDDEISSIEQEEHNEELNNLIQKNKNRRCDILEQRDETVLESARTNRQNLGLLCAVFLVLSTIFALNYEDDIDLWLIICSGVFFLLSLIFYFHKRKATVQRINHVRGTVDSINSIEQKILVGDSLSLTYPKHWEKFLPESSTMISDMDVTVEKRELIRFGHSLAISKEIEQYGPPHFWGRNCFLFIVASVLSCFIYFSSSSLHDDVLFSYRWLTNQPTTWKIDNIDALKQSSIKKGDWVELHLGGASCSTSYYIYACSKVFINNKTLDLDDKIALPNWVALLANNSLISTKQQSYNDYNFGYNSQQKYTKLINANQLALIVDAECKTNNNGSCIRLRSIFTQLFSDRSGKTFESWQQVVDYVNSHDDVAQPISVRLVNEIETLFQTLSASVFSVQKKLLINILTKQQNEEGNIVLNLTNQHHVQVNTRSYSFNRNNLDVNKFYLLYYYDILSSANGHVNMQGFVSDIVYNADGSYQRLDIHANPRYAPVANNNEMIPAILVNVVVCSVIGLITVIQGLIMLFRIRANSRRLKQIQHEYRYLA